MKSRARPRLFEGTQLVPLLEQRVLEASKQRPSINVAARIDSAYVKTLFSNRYDEGHAASWSEMDSNRVG
jgi:hypothetical protein